jgi:DNA polymerase-1
MGVYGIDLETHDPCLKDEGVSWVYGKGHIIATGLYEAKYGERHAYSGNGGTSIKRLLLDSEVTLIGTNIGYDLGWLCYEHNLSARDVACSLVDVSMAEQCIDEYQPYSLDALALKYLNERKETGKLPAIAARMGLKGDFRVHLQTLFDAEFKAEIADYVMADADQPVRIWERQKRILEETGCMEAAVCNFKLIKIALDMKQRGVRIDMDKRRVNYRRLKTIQDDLRAKFEQQYGKMNFNSPKQLAELFERQGVPYKRKIRIKGDTSGKVFTGLDLWEQRARLKQFVVGVCVEKGQLVTRVDSRYAGRMVLDLYDRGYITTCNPSIDKYALKVLKKDHAVVRAIIDLKQVTSIIDKFLGPKFDRYIVKHGENNYRIHADVNPVGARKTGRFSCSNPNLQQVTSKLKLYEGTPEQINLAEICRELFIPDTGHFFLRADYSQIEYRLFAHVALGDGADAMRKQYEDEHADFHDWAMHMSGLDQIYEPGEARKYAKNLGFGCLYGMQRNRMQQSFGWDVDKAKALYEAYHKALPCVKATMDAASEIIVQRGYVVSVGGRRLHLQKINGKPDIRSAYKALNQICQGGAADMMKLALIAIWEAGFDTRLTIHDEVVCDVAEMLGEDLTRLKIIMETALPLSVPVIAEPEFTRDFYHGIKKVSKREIPNSKEAVA